VDQSLLVENTATPEQEPATQAPDRALDKDIRFGQVYEYSAQRVVRVPIDGQTLELASELSAPVRVETLDVFPPAVPTGLAAVATVSETGAGAGTETGVDLNWQPDTETDLAGYAVYRREGNGEWQRISPAQPLASPAFRDALTLPGHTYTYAVSAIDQGGHESARSAEAQETVPTP
jgi:hypothetical protein